MSTPVHNKWTFAIAVGLVCLLTASVASALPVVADVRTDFSGNQGQDNWLYGYYDRTADLAGGGDGIYDAASEFTEFLGGVGQGPHSATNHWTGSSWRYVDPVTGLEQYLIINQTNVHPCTENPYRPEALVIQRWVSEVGGLIHIDGAFLNASVGTGEGTTGRVFVNGVEKYSEVTAANTVDFLLHEIVSPGDYIDIMVDYAPGHSGTATTQVWTTISIPEPATLTLFGLGLVGLIGCRRRRQGR